MILYIVFSIRETTEKKHNKTHIHINFTYNIIINHKLKP